MVPHFTETFEVSPETVGGKEEGVELLLRSLQRSNWMWEGVPVKNRFLLSPHYHIVIMREMEKWNLSFCIRFHFK